MPGLSLCVIYYIMAIYYNLIYVQTSLACVNIPRCFWRQLLSDAEKINSHTHTQLYYNIIQRSF